MKHIRYALTPQMLDYDSIGQMWVPYLMYFHSPQYTSTALNTDSRGFRVTYKGADKIEDFKNIKDISFSILVGGSQVFGVGATHDKYTIPSIMNERSADLWLNFGGRAFSSTQEFQLFLFYYQHLKNIKKIVVMSGLNNLLLYYTSRNYSKELGVFFFQSEYTKRMNQSQMCFKRKAMKFVLEPFLGTALDYGRISMEELKQRIFSKNPLSISPKAGGEASNKDDLLAVLERDIINWKIFAKALNIEFHYVLQPMADWIKKNKSKEEAALFEALDCHQGPSWAAMKNKLNYECYEWFNSKLQDICIRQGVNYFDMNRALSDMHLDGEWLFVDRAHCTNQGNALISKILCERVI
ncbi:MAG: hypothetical protein HQL26_07550 [Candidatus Omnitrophica bacterium]|nr:hypothetical protein [Candidatus Omnitrophota bacterium]